MIARNGCLALLGVLLALPGAAWARPRFLYVTAEAAQVREEPAPVAKVLAESPASSRLYGVEKVEDWYQVRLDDGRTGFVSRIQVTDDPPQRVFVEVDRTSVRKSPGMLGSSLAEVRRGQELVALDEENDWLRVQMADGRTGWISDKEVDDDHPTAVFVKAVGAAVRAACNPTSEILLEPKVGTELARGEEIAGYVRIALVDGRSGCIRESAVTGKPPLRILVDRPRADLRSVPSAQLGEVVGTVAAGQELRSFDEEDHHYLVVTAEGVVGWIGEDAVLEMGQ